MTPQGSQEAFETLGRVPDRIGTGATTGILTCSFMRTSLDVKGNLSPRRLREVMKGQSINRML